MEANYGKIEFVPSKTLLGVNRISALGAYVDSFYPRASGGGLLAQ